MTPTLGRLTGALASARRTARTASDGQLTKARRCQCLHHCWLREATMEVINDLVEASAHVAKAVAGAGQRARNIEIAIAEDKPKAIGTSSLGLLEGLHSPPADSPRQELHHGGHRGL